MYWLFIYFVIKNFIFTCFCDSFFFKLQIILLQIADIFHLV